MSTAPNNPPPPPPSTSTPPTTPPPEQPSTPPTPPTPPEQPPRPPELEGVNFRTPYEGGGKIPPLRLRQPHLTWKGKKGRSEYFARDAVYWLECKSLLVGVMVGVVSSAAVILMATLGICVLVIILALGNGLTPSADWLLSSLLLMLVTASVSSGAATALKECRPWAMKVALLLGTFMSRLMDKSLEAEEAKRPEAERGNPYNAYWPMALQPGDEGFGEGDPEWRAKLPPHLRRNPSAWLKMPWRDRLKIDNAASEAVIADANAKAEADEREEP